MVLINKKNGLTTISLIGFLLSAFALPVFAQILPGAHDVSPELQKIPEVTTSKETGRDAKSYCNAITPPDSQKNCCIPERNYGVGWPDCEYAVIKASGQQAGLIPTKKFADPSQQNYYNLQIQYLNRCFSLGKISADNKCFNESPEIKQQQQISRAAEDKFDCSKTTTDAESSACFDSRNQASRELFGIAREANKDWDAWRKETVDKAASIQTKKQAGQKPQEVKRAEKTTEAVTKTPPATQQTTEQPAPTQQPSPAPRFRLIESFYGKITLPLKDFFRKIFRFGR
ncbi:MAG: hypothetical protein HZB99_03695 [Candidatus Harrisonbacteria bacterium]|nr:hypothetical protein [Candidatus Harrisonbacteria bacterium]